MKTRKQVKNITDMTADLLDMYNQVRDNDIGISEAKAAANVAGKVISSIKIKIEYNKMTGLQSKIKFMED